MPFQCQPASCCPKGSSPSQQSVELPAHSISFQDTSVSRKGDDENSCMDLCSSSSSSSSDDDSVSVVGKKPSPSHSTQKLKQKLQFAKGLFSTAPKQPKVETIDLCSPRRECDKDEVERSRKRLKRLLNNKVFDQVKACDRRPLTQHPSVLLSASRNESYRSSSDDTEWSEYGVLSSTENKSRVMPLKDVTPAFSPSELSFFTAMKLNNIEDLEGADANDLSIHLLESPSFRKACAFYAWKDNKPLRDYLRVKVARNIVTKWKNRLVSLSPDETAATDEHATTENIEAGNTELLLENTDAKDVPLTGLLSNEEAMILRDHCGIETATQLIDADRQYISQTLSGILASRFDGRSSRELECICEGMLYSWVLRSREALEGIESAATTMAKEMSESEDEQIQHPNIKTPLSYVDLLFLEQEGIYTDSELSRIDPSLLTRKYTTFLHSKGKEISHVDANKKLKQLRLDASRVCSGSANIIEPLFSNRLDLSKLPGVMLKARNLCKTTITNNGLPKKTLVVYDDQNYVLYEFLVTTDVSRIPNSGMGAFLTFKGAKVLKKSSHSKAKEFFARTPVTRKPRDAQFPSGSGATVTIKGKGLHGDEHNYNTENEDSVGIWNEFTRDDFVEHDSNITFSSTHIGCALIELDRYAPVLKIDRKDELTFGFKDFIFAHEPQSWRFDVKEKLNGNNQVVDFTDDTTGSPHAAARAKMAMYVNECGHDNNLVENVCSLESSCRSVSYYIYIDKPMQAGETRELLINYRENYESMRERRGYGLANIYDGVKGDDDDGSRILRNHKERLLTETTVMSCSEEEIRNLATFIKEKVLCGVIEATSNASSDANMDVLTRQFLARRRIHWLSKLCERRLLELISNQEVVNLADDDNVGIFHKGMVVFVHGWMNKNDPRPQYKGLATITSISRDKFDRYCFELSLPEGKYLTNVPAAVVTLPEESDFADAPQRLRVHYLKTQKERHRPQVRSDLLKDLSSIEWGLSSLCQRLPTLPKTMQTSLMWEVAEEVLHKATKDNILQHPLNEVVSKFAQVIKRNELAPESASKCGPFYEELCTIVGINK